MRGSERPVAVITGASAGVGRATARAFAAAGFDLGLLARGEAGLEAAAREVESAGSNVLTIPCDVSHYEEVDAAADAIEARLGPIAVWVNNAMTTVFAPFGETAPDDFRRAVEVTFLGQVWGTKAALARMRPRDFGSIVNVGSALSFVGIPLQSAYCASKFACRGFFEAARAELVHDGSHVMMSMVHLPAVNTPQFDWCRTVFSRQPQPVPPIYQPELCARRILEVALSGQPQRILGSWNRLLIFAARAAPGLAVQFAGRGAWEEQLTASPVGQRRPDNLFSPADHEHDFGSHGRFDARAKGFWTPSFLVTLPKAVREFFVAFLAAAHERLGTRDQSLAARRHSAQPVGD